MDTNNLLSVESCNSLLQNYTKRKNCTVSSCTIDPLIGGGLGLIGEHFTVKMRYQSDGNVLETDTFFLKVLNGSSGVIFELAMSLGAYEKEEFWYTLLLKEFSRCGIDITFSPKSYLCQPHFIVLEDLTCRGFKSVSQQNFDLAHCKVALEILAKFHSSSIIYEEIESKKLGKSYTLIGAYEENLDDKFCGSNKFAKLLNCTFEALAELIDSIPGELDVKKFRKLAESVQNRLKNLSKYKGTLLHGDLWCNNFLFSYNEDGRPSRGMLVDYQFLKYGPPALDVVQLLASNTRTEFRGEHYGELIAFYYEKFGECFKSKGIDGGKVLPYAQFLEACDEVKVTVKLLVLADRSITNLSAECFEQVLESDESLRHFMYKDRSKLIIDCFKNNSFYRELLMEDITELLAMV